jgi:hypothetical protein
MTTQRKAVNSLCEIFRIPLLVGVVSAIGLASALMGDGIWDMFSWITLGFPVAVAIFYTLVLLPYIRR